MTDALIHIVTLTGDDYEEAVDQGNDRGGSTEAVVSYLAQWDYGEETDEADEILGTRSREEIKALPHMKEVVLHGGLTYLLVFDHGLRFYSLYRPPLAPTVMKDSKPFLT